MHPQQRSLRACLPRHSPSRCHRPVPLQLTRAHSYYHGHLRLPAPRRCLLARVRQPCGRSSRGCTPVRSAHRLRFWPLTTITGPCTRPTRRRTPRPTRQTLALLPSITRYGGTGGRGAHRVVPGVRVLVLPQLNSKVLPNPSAGPRERSSAVPSRSCVGVWPGNRRGPWLLLGAAWRCGSEQAGSLVTPSCGPGP